MPLYREFQTDKKLESTGVEVDYGDCKITVARAGGANKAFRGRLEKVTQPHRRAIQNNSLPPESAESLYRQVFAETVVVNWETKVDGEWVKGIEKETGKGLLPVTVENVILTLEKLPDLYADLQGMANNSTLFKKELMEGDAKN